MGFNLGKMLGLNRAEREIRKSLKQLGLHDDLVKVLRESGEVLVRSQLSAHGVIGFAQDVVLLKLKEVVK